MQVCIYRGCYLAIKRMKFFNFILNDFFSLQTSLIILYGYELHLLIFIFSYGEKAAMST